MLQEELVELIDGLPSAEWVGLAYLPKLVAGSGDGDVAGTTAFRGVCEVVRKITCSR
jgi:hypothetical protein